ncbi:MULTISPECIES: CaiB/BaiF CoA-transferase family protein [unclassified Microbacterium]|uniref:CaiB/BaiF CoA transferase family protein n=1 Tax=unclassified Microbacterium TaxID=2609290 RepID=UPI0025D097C5|nr:MULTISPECIES: CaiB/BaiF CoA-transferase family protein [unclassified Microbacterium]
MTQPAPLTGIKVLDLTRILPGPFATMMLADLGADVVKVEHPRGGDPERSNPPLGDAGSVRFGMLNRRKRSVAIDLKADRGRELVLRLAADADVVIEGFRPGLVTELGIGPDVVREINPRVVYASLSGYGQTGPYAALPGHDINYMALSGLLRYFGTSDQPRIPWLPIADIGGGATMAVSGILAALIGRNSSGVGDYLDLSMAEGALYWQQTRAQWWIGTGQEPLPNGLPVTGALPGYGIYATADEDWLSLGCMEPVFWERLCALLNMEDDIPRQHDHDAFGELDARLRERIRGRTVGQWFEVMQAKGIPAAPLLTIGDALTNEHFAARGLLGGSAPEDAVRSPFVFTDAERPRNAAAPALGEDTDGVLRDVGVSAEELIALREAGVVR